MSDAKLSSQIVLRVESSWRGRRGQNVLRKCFVYLSIYLFIYSIAPHDNFSTFF